MKYYVSFMDGSGVEVDGVTNIVQSDGFITFLVIETNTIVASFNQTNVSHFIIIGEKNEKN